MKKKGLGHDLTVMYYASLNAQDVGSKLYKLNKIHLGQHQGIEQDPCLGYRALLGYSLLLYSIELSLKIICKQARQDPGNTHDVVLLFQKLEQCQKDVFDKIQSNHKDINLHSWTSYHTKFNREHKGPDLIVVNKKVDAYTFFRYPYSDAGIDLDSVHISSKMQDISRELVNIAKTYITK